MAHRAKPMGKKNMRGEVAVQDDLQFFGRSFHNHRAARFGPLVQVGAVGHL